MYFSIAHHVLLGIHYDLWSVWHFAEKNQNWYEWIFLLGNDLMSSIVADEIMQILIGGSQPNTNYAIYLPRGTIGRVMVSFNRLRNIGYAMQCKTRFVFQ